MRLSRLRSGEWLALAGGVALLVLLPVRWFAVSTPQATFTATESGFGSIGWFAVLLVLAAIVSALALAITTLTRSGPALPVGLAVMSTATGVLATLAILVRLVLQPGLGIGAGNADVDLRWPVLLALLSAVAIAVGGWRAMADERTDGAESREQRRRALAVRGPVRPPPPRGAGESRGATGLFADPPR